MALTKHELEQWLSYEPETGVFRWSVPLDSRCGIYQSRERSRSKAGRKDMSQKEKDWSFDDAPKIPGWYAVLVCWNSREGVFPSFDYWSGENWSNNSPITAFSGPHESQKIAEDWAYEHNPDK